jgi:pimeloyl-ACP methyl ester carboxylesterase
VAIKIRWFFVEEGQQSLPFPTIFHSTNWRTDGDYINPLGEVPGAPRPWVNGESPWVWRDNLVCGAAEVHSHGQLFSTRVDFEPLNWGIPPCCDPAPLGKCPTLFDIGVNHPSVWYALAVLIRGVYNRDEIKLTELFENLLGSGCIIKFSFPTDNLNCGFAVAWNDRQVLVIIEGSRNWYQFIFNILGTLLPAFPVGFGRINGAMWSFAADVQTRLSLLGAPIDLPRIHAGHSLGGVIAQYLMAVRKQFDPERVQHCITFGAPKGGDLNFANFIRPNLTEIRTENDPVPFLPINFSEFIFLHVPVPIGLRLIWDLYVKPSVGYSVSPIGAISEDLSSVGAFSDIVAISQAIITGVYRDEPNGHYIATYCDYLQHAAAALPAIPDCTLDVEEIEVIDDSFPDVNPRCATFRATTMDVYRNGNAPPAAPDVAGVPILIYANFWIRGEAGEGDAAVGHFSHVAIIEAPFIDIRDDYNEGTRGALFDTVYVPDKTGTGLVVRFVETMADPETAALSQRVYLDRKKPVPFPSTV